MTDAGTRGLLEWFHEYNFADGGVVESAVVEPGAFPFEISRWDVAPGQRNDLDVHISTEVWLVTKGSGVLTLKGVESRLRPGDAVVVLSRPPPALQRRRRSVSRCQRALDDAERRSSRWATAAPAPNSPVTEIR
jgi:hypothetical protein